MPSTPKSPHQYRTRSPDIDRRIQDLVATIPADGFDRKLLAELMTSAYRLGEDQATTGDLKLLNSSFKELRYAFSVFRPYRHVRKVAMFGSARIPVTHPAFAIGKQFGRLMAKAGWMVITGAASGIMRAGHEGAGKNASVGLNIRLPFEQEANLVIAEDRKLVNCKYFFTRKLLFIKESHATVLFPGGFGTLDEGFESLTLVQTGKSDPRPIIFVDLPGGRFWQPLIKFFDRQLIAGGMVSAGERSIYHLTSSADAAAAMIQRFYSTYHSLRYVDKKLVLRLTHALPPGAPGRLTREFKDIIVSGSIVQTAALPEESEETDLQRLPRLVFTFNRKDYGRLIDLVHRINELG